MVRRMAFIVAVVVAVALTTGAWAQLASPEAGLSAVEMARAGTGVALPAAHTTGGLNPAALGMLYRMPAAKHDTDDMAGAGGMSGVAWADGHYFGEGLLAFPRQSELGGLGLQPEAERLAGIDVPTELWLAPAGRRGSQVFIESRFLTVDQQFMRGLGVDTDLSRTDFVTTGWTFDLEDNQSVDIIGANYGGPGRDWSFGINWADTDFEELLRLTAARNQSTNILSAPTILSLGGSVASIDVRQDTKYLVDVGAIASADTSVFGQQATGAVGAVVHDLFGEFDDDFGLGTRVDIGGSISTDNWSFALDLVDVLDNTSQDLPEQFNLEGRHLRTSVTVRAGDTIIIGGLIRDEGTIGVQQRIPILRDIPYIGAAFTHTPHEDRAELLIFITPRIVKGEQ